MIDLGKARTADTNFPIARYREATEGRRLVGKHVKRQWLQCWETVEDLLVQDTMQVNTHSQTYSLYISVKTQEMLVSVSES